MPARSEAFNLSDYQTVTVRSRTEDEDIVAYVNEVARMVSISHQARNCKQHEADIVLPVDKEKGIGH